MTWAFDLLVSVTSRGPLVWHHPTTGNTILHDLAKAQNYTLLHYLLSLGVMNDEKDRNGRTFVYYIEDAETKKYLQSMLDRLLTELPKLANRLLSNPSSILTRRFTPAMVDTMKDNLQSDARKGDSPSKSEERSFATITSRAKAIAPIKKPTIEEQERQANEALQSLMEILDKEEAAKAKKGNESNSNKSEKKKKGKK